MQRGDWPAEVFVRSLRTPLGPLQLSTDRKDRVVALDFGPRETVEARLTKRGCRVIASAQAAATAADQLVEYFAGARRRFELVLAPVGTGFQLRVWEQLRRIPFGETATYGEIARRIGQPGASRAVGGANGRNPISIIIPCHRVVAAGGKLGGYSSGLERKRALLRLEGSRLI